MVKLFMRLIVTKRMKTPIKCESSLRSRDSRWARSDAEEGQHL